MFVGLDLGGTSLKAGLVEENGVLLRCESCPSGLICDAQSLLAQLLALTERVCEGIPKERIASVGLGVPGATEGGEILYTCNLPLAHVPIASLFRSACGLPLLLENDANCAAWGEYLCGAQRGAKSLLVITLGTGIGGGMVVDGKIYRGLGLAGEIGHMVIKQGGELCSCGRRGCWESYASASGLRRRTCARMGLADAGARTAFLEARRGNPVAQELCREYVDDLALGVTNLVNILHPEVVALGGGVSNEEDASLLLPLRERVERDCYAAHGGVQTKIIKATGHAGILGAALLGCTRGENDGNFKAR